MALNLAVDYTTLDMLPVFVMVADANGNVLFFNRYWHEYTGQSRDERLEWARYVHPADVERVGEQWQRAVENGSVVEIHHRIYNQATSAYRWIQTRAAPFRDASGTITHWIGLAMDVEEHHRAIALSSDLASKLQELYAPSGLPVSDVAYFSAWYEPAQQRGTVGGDWYKAIRLDENRILFAVGDVVGHGLEAAIMMGRARQAVLTVAANDEGPANILRRANRALILQDVVASCGVGILDLRTRHVSLALAGQCPPLFVEASSAVQFFGTPGLPLGVERDASYVEYGLEAAPGSTLILYTDGLIEFDRDVLAGQRRIVEASSEIQKIAGPNLAQEFATRVLHGVTHDDDIAVLAIAF